MKLSTLLVIALLGFIAYRLSSPQRPVETSSAEPTPTPLAPAKTKPSRPLPPAKNPAAEDLIVVHGIVSQVGDDSLVIECTAPDDGGIGRIRLDATASTGDSLNLAQAAINHDLKIYGKVVKISGGNLLAAEWIPAKKATGVLRLYDFPGALKRGSKVNVVAAPLGEDAYTVSFKEPEEVRKAWMWERHPVGRGPNR